ncbi:putative Quinoprotein glucose dehydrogenase [Cocos nucifera]|nr:putative Quinoprotein glucose dehydrogenase [Cocos nucifera]
MAQTPPSNGRAGDIRIWVISGFFLILLITAGVLLVLYFVLPESEVTVWFPSIAMILVGIPWAFWIMTCFYRYMTGRGPEIVNRQPNRVRTVTPASSSKTSKTSAANNCSPINSPGSARNVHFGAAATPGGLQGVAGGAETSGAKVDVDADREFDATNKTANSNNEGSSLASHESEVPLAFSMS